MLPPNHIATALSQCPVCGHKLFSSKPVLWEALITEWGISPAEVEYINRQQGFRCMKCDCNLRSMCLAKAIMRYFRFDGLFTRFVRYRCFRLRILEINEAGDLSYLLARAWRHKLVSYPENDMTSLKFADSSFDLVVHSDTLEHVPNPLQGLRECHRVLAPRGICCYTVPIIIGRLSRSRDGLPPSYHGAEHDRKMDYTVQTEFGADAWTLPILAGFSECRVVTTDFPAGIALTCVR
jgi:SAM-dependent methyltransferase